MLEGALLLFDTVQLGLGEVVGQAGVPEVIDGVLQGSGNLDLFIVLVDHVDTEVVRHLEGGRVVVI